MLHVTSWYHIDINVPSRPTACSTCKRHAFVGASLSNAPLLQIYKKTEYNGRTALPFITVVMWHTQVLEQRPPSSPALAGPLPRHFPDCLSRSSCAVALTLAARPRGTRTRRAPEPPQPLTELPRPACHAAAFRHHGHVQHTRRTRTVRLERKQRQHAQRRSGRLPPARAPAAQPVRLLQRPGHQAGGGEAAGAGGGGPEHVLQQEARHDGVRVPGGVHLLVGWKRMEGSNNALARWGWGRDGMQQSMYRSAVEVEPTSCLLMCARATGQLPSAACPRRHAPRTGSGPDWTVRNAKLHLWRRRVQPGTAGYSRVQPGPAGSRRVATRTRSI